MLLSKRDLETLAQEQAEGCVSIYMPTAQAGQRVEENPIRLKNLLDQAEERLQAIGMDLPEAQALLEPARDLLEDMTFWQHQREGLALFLSPDVAQAYRLPFEFTSLAVVGERFDIKPLMPILSGDGQFYLLALNKDDVMLYEGTRYGLHPVEVEDLPEGFTELLQEEEQQRYLEFHTRTRVPGAPGEPRPVTPQGRGIPINTRVGGEAVGGRPAVFHGHAAFESNVEDEILRYFRRIDTALQGFLSGQRIPMVVAADEGLLDLYQEANTYNHLVEEGITQNPQSMGEEELQARAWDILAPRFRSDREAYVNTYRMFAGREESEKATSDIAEVVPAAQYARVGVLFVARGVQRWGTFDPESHDVEVHTEYRPGDEDLLDRAAVQTFLHDGVVYAVTPEDVPDADAPLAALLRY